MRSDRDDKAIVQYWSFSSLLSGRYMHIGCHPVLKGSLYWVCVQSGTTSILQQLRLYSGKFLENYCLWTNDVPQQIFNDNDLLTSIFYNTFIKVKCVYIEMPAMKFQFIPYRSKGGNYFCFMWNYIYYSVLCTVHTCAIGSTQVKRLPYLKIPSVKGWTNIL